MRRIRRLGYVIWKRDAMADPTDTNLGDLNPTEASPRFNAIYLRMYEWQFGMEALRRLDEEDLIYIAGHRQYDFPKPADMTDEVALGIQQKMRGNALRARDELDRRQWAEQMELMQKSADAVLASNQSVADTAQSTRKMANATIAVAIFAALTLIASVVIALRN